MLTLAFYFFKDTALRKADYKGITGSSTFPKKFYSTRWVENGAIGQRFLDIYPHLKRYVEQAPSNPLRESLESWKCVKACLSGKLLKAKFMFFVSVANDVEPFLKKLQTSKPMAPFLIEAVVELSWNLLRQFSKRDVVNQNQAKLIRKTQATYNLF